MNQQQNNLLFALLNSAVSGRKLDKTYSEFLSTDVLNELYNLSSKHDISHLISYALDLNGLIDRSMIRIEGNIYQKFHKAQLFSVFRTQQLSIEYDMICLNPNLHNTQKSPKPHRHLHHYLHYAEFLHCLG